MTTDYEKLAEIIDDSPVNLMEMDDRDFDRFMGHIDHNDHVEDVLDTLCDLAIIDRMDVSALELKWSQHIINEYSSID